MVLFCADVKAAVTLCYLELKHAAIQLYPASLLLFYPPAESNGNCPQINFYSREQYHMEITEQPEATVYETLFDFFI